MGWDNHHATHRKKDGSIDLKAECDSLFLEGLNKGHYEVLKSAVVNSVYYAAIRDLRRYVGEDENGESIYENIVNGPVWAAVILTQTTDGYMDFYWKELGEYMANEYDCPPSILKLLSPTEDKQALWWRGMCKKKRKQNKLKKEGGKYKLDRIPCGA